MRDIIIKRIGELFEWEPPTSTSMRWQACWFKSNFEQFGRASNKQIAEHKLTHIGQLDWQSMSDEVLAGMFELIVMKAYRQYG
jgi:hypothetical protein